MFRKLRARIVLAVLMLAASASSHAAFHDWKISEVYSNSDGTVQFIELSTASPGQQFVGGHQISTTQGVPFNVFTFPGDLPADSANKKFLIGTAGYAALPGVPPPDYIIPNGFVFTSNVTFNFAAFDVFTIPSIPTDGTLSMNRVSITPPSFAAATNSPTNFAGVTGTVVLPNPPAAPTIGTATPGNGQATISFTPGSDGGSPITSFKVTCSSTFQGNRTASGTASPITVLTLTNNNPYLCSVTATNANGTGQASAAVDVTPLPSVPGAPAITSATPGDGQTTIGFNPPASDGGAAISNFIATCSGVASSGQSSPITVGGLSNGTIYSCTVAAVNSAGTGPQSSAVNVTPMAAATVPGTPSITGAVPGNAQATISFTTPADGGSAITSYRVNCAPGAVVVTANASPVTVSGLANGTNYSCTVTAINAVGPGTASTSTNVTPRTVPGAPIIGSATPGNTVVSIAFTPPSNNGGSAITGYTATCGAISASATTSPIAVTGLTNGTVYACTVTASNVAGNSAASAVVFVVPATLPGAPTIGTTIPGDGRGAVSFTPPASNGGAAITGYTATCGANSATGLASPITVTGLANTVPVLCSVIATNAVGSSAPSVTASVTPSDAAPLTPVAVVARKIHGAAGPFDLSIDTGPTITGAVSVEPRGIGNGHTIVFQFNVPVSATGIVTVTPVGSVTAVASGFDVMVTLANVPDNRRATISLVNVNNAGVNVEASIGFLVGDANSTRSVNSSDISGVKARVGQTTTGANFRFDVNATGTISATDISAVKARSGLVLP